MPHLTLETSSNLKLPPHRELFAQLHDILTTEGVPIGNCKSRVVEREAYQIADGDARHAFVHLDLKFVAGRGGEAVKRIGDRMLRVLVDQFREPSLDVQVTVHISEMTRETYFKHPTGTI